jgi:RNA:NAD 2'-phosphotransferase (TPT1/KptA family)
MRNLIDLVESHDQPPSELYHGTSKEAWADIQECGVFYPSDHRDDLALSLTGDFNVAARFARDGVVLTLDAELLAQHYTLERYHDSGVFHHEDEWRILAPKILNFPSYVIEVEETGY